MTTDSRQPAHRNLALDRARTFITLLVVIHHSVIPYTYYGHTDAQWWLGFDLVVTFFDSFFMAAMFLVSGLFVWPSLHRKGIGSFLRDRALRLGLPFAVMALLLMPLAYYAFRLQFSPVSDFPVFWWKTVTIGPWQSGPAWFLFLLLAFDMLAALMFAAAPTVIAAIGNLSRRGFAHPEHFLIVFLGASIVVYVPAVLYFGTTRWFALGPIVVQASRIGLYGLYFIVGVGIGAHPFDQGVLATGGKLAQRWRRWLALTIVSFLTMTVLIVVKRVTLPDPGQPNLMWQALYAFVFVGFSIAQTFNVLALFLRFGNCPRNALDPLRADAYGIYIVHFVPVLWVQYALFHTVLTPVTQLTAITKATIAFAVALPMSWAVTALLRKLPGATRVL